MRDLVGAYIEKYKLLTFDKPVLVGVSGGADSIALLTLLAESGYCCIAAHCNFHLRGEESLRDELFVRQYAEQLQIPFCKTDFDTEAYALQHKLSIEMAARELRYNWFEEQLLVWNAQAIAVAHHRDDSTETLLMNLLRGSGIRGMRGIQPRNGKVVRPFLAVSRDMILNWLAGKQISFVTDSSNQSDQYTRNFIRLRVLPLLEEINPSASETIARTAENLSATAEIYEQAVEEFRQKIWINANQLDIDKLLACPAPETVLYELLQSFHFSRIQISSIFRALGDISGKQFYSSTHYLLKDRNRIFVYPLNEVAVSSQSYELDLSKSFYTDPVRIEISRIQPDDQFVIPKAKNTACLDADKLKAPLYLRRWQKGDWFIPFGMRGRKKLSDYFSDHKWNLLQKEQAWLLCSGDDIIWLVGERTDDRFKLDKTTKNCLILKYFD